MENENLVNENEVLQNEVEAGEGSAEVEAVDYTEILEQIYGEMQTQTETLMEIKTAYEVNYDALMELSGSVLVLLVLSVLTFCWSCMRQWRKNVLKIGE